MTLRVVARSIRPDDDVGDVALGVAGLATRCGLPTRLYAYATNSELAGIVAPIGDLWGEVAPGDTVFHCWSMEDEFLPQVAALGCRKIIYFRDMPCSEWLLESDSGYAASLDRARRQYSHFGSFDAALADSERSLAEILTHLGPGKPAAVCAPGVDPSRFSRLGKEAVPLPAARSVWLWIGQLAPHNRPEAAISLFSRRLSEHPDDLLAMVCRGRGSCPSCAQRIREMMDSLPETERERIVMLEDVSDAELAWLYGTADVLLHTGGHGDFCRSVPVARAFGLDLRTLPHESVYEACREADSCRSAGTLLHFLHDPR